MKVEIITIGDSSGSMGSVLAEVIGGYNNFIAEQRELPGEARATLVTFDDKVIERYAAVPLEHVPQLNRDGYWMGGWTAMNDAIGDTLTRHRDRVLREGWADKVIVNIMTDGQENRSRRYTTPQVKSMIAEAKAAGWEFIFMAANIDAFSTGAQYGFAMEHTHQFTATGAGTQAAYSTMSAATRSLRGTTF